MGKRRDYGLRAPTHAHQRPRAVWGLWVPLRFVVVDPRYAPVWSTA